MFIKSPPEIFLENITNCVRNSSVVFSGNSAQSPKLYKKNYKKCFDSPSEYFSSNIQTKIMRGIGEKPNEYLCFKKSLGGC